MENLTSNNRVSRMHAPDYGYRGNLPTTFATMVLLVLVLVAISFRSFAQNITVLALDGPFFEALNQAVLKPLETRQSLATTVSLRGSSPPALHGYDVVFLSSRELADACRTNLLAPIEPGQFSFPNSTDFLSVPFEGRLRNCGVAISSYSMPIVFDKQNFSGDTPSTFRDFFDLDRFPGRRGLRMGPQGNLELALLADNVSRADLYSVLQTKEGRERAFRKLDEIRDVIYWWSDLSMIPALLSDGSIAMSTFYSDLLGNLPHGDYGIVWDGLILDMSYMAIPTTSSNPDLALQFIKFGVEPQVQLDLSSILGSGTISIIQTCSDGKCRCKGTNNCDKSCCNCNSSVLSGDFWSMHSSDILDEFEMWRMN